METLIAFLVGAFIGVLITSLTVFAAFKMVEEKILPADYELKSLIDTNWVESILQNVR